MECVDGMVGRQRRITVPLPVTHRCAFVVQYTQYIFPAQ